METTSPLLFVLHVAGAAALLIWAVRLVRTGVERAFSVQLRRWLRRSSESRLMAAGTGVIAAVMLQSSTAVTILVANFAASGTIVASAALVMLLGADLGSAVVAQILLVRQSWLVPVLLLLGVVLFLRGQDRRIRQVGRILIGLSLIFVSLDMIREATEPLRDSPGMATAMGYLGRDLLTAFVLGALFAWVVHSSVAAVLLYVTLVLQGVMPVPAAVAMVLGANLGGSFIAYVLTLAQPLEARRVVVANLVLRGGGAALVLGSIFVFNPPLDWLGATPARIVINLHLAFNLVLALALIPLAGPVTRAATALLPPKPDPAAALQRVSALDPVALDIPDRAIACAAREVLRIGEEIEAMLRSAINMYDHWDDATAAAIEAQQKAVDRMHFETKLYLAQINRAKLDEETATRSIDLSTIAINLEAASDAIARSMLGLARRLHLGGVAFSDAGWREIRDFHDRVLSNVQLALNVLMTLEPDAARELVAEKEAVRDIEQALQRSHLGRLQQGLAESIETSNIHQETLRALKTVNTAFSMAAYPILAESGDLLSSRLSGAAR
ncbi:Na/Pi cotransporter family protein [Phaeovulum sp.]|uniref:Na/Pi cotransporter family protein n=1 Tax=Phaeovulum sp. TaxID=2934796 RepID=UPI0039E59627